MFIGHLGVGFAGKKAYASPSLGTYFAAAQLPDALWPIFLLAGWEQVVIAPGDTVVLVCLLALLYAASVLGPPPPNERALAIVQFSGWLFIPWASWIDRHRSRAGDV